MAAHTLPRGTSLLFIGNSFTFGANSPVQFYRADTVTDLNNEGIGGVPALFKSFTTQAGLDYDVSLETRGGSGLDFHLENKLAAIGSKPWDKVVMHGQSTLDFDKPGDPAKLVATTRKMADFLREHNPKVEIFLTATWSRADQTYQGKGPWLGKPIDAMARDVRAAYDAAAAGVPNVKGVIPVGEAWNRAIQTGIADPNPYDGIEARQDRPVDERPLSRQHARVLPRGADGLRHAHRARSARARRNGVLRLRAGPVASRT